MNRSVYLQSIYNSIYICLSLIQSWLPFCSLKKKNQTPKCSFDAVTVIKAHGCRQAHTQPGTETSSLTQPAASAEQEPPSAQQGDAGMGTPSALVKPHLFKVLLEDLLEYLIAKKKKKTFDLGPDLVE